MQRTNNKRLLNLKKEIVFDLVDACRKNEKYLMIEGHKIRAFSIRYYNFVKNGFTCCKCGIKAEYAGLDKNTYDNTPHINLYAISKNSKKEVMLTFDHIFPKSFGGIDHVKNGQVMCEYCNSNKSNTTRLTQDQAIMLGLATKETVEKACC